MFRVLVKEYEGTRMKEPGIALGYFRTFLGFYNFQLCSWFFLIRFSSTAVSKPLSAHARTAEISASVSLENTIRISRTSLSTICHKRKQVTSTSTSTRLVSWSVCQWVSERGSEWVSQSVSQSVSESVSESVNDSLDGLSTNSQNNKSPSQQVSISNNLSRNCWIDQPIDSHNNIRTVLPTLVAISLFAAIILAAMWAPLWVKETRRSLVQSAVSCEIKSCYWKVNLTESELKLDLICT